MICPAWVRIAHVGHRVFNCRTRCPIREENSMRKWVLTCCLRIVWGIGNVDVGHTLAQDVVTLGIFLQNRA